MKKIFMFIAGVAAAMTMQAASYSEAVQITMSCEGGAETQQLVLIVDPGLTSPATVANLASSYEVGQVNFYVADGAAKYSQYKANAISNLPLAIVTNRRDVSYTFTFNVPISTNGLVLTDLRSNEGIKNIPMNNGDSYTFSVADEASYVANTNVTIADRFVINYVPAPVPTDYTVTPNAEGYATFSAAEATVIPDGVTVYKGAIAGEELQLTAISGHVPANTGVIVKGTAGTDYTFAIYSGSVDALEGNDLKPTSAYSYPMANVYVLKGDAFLEYIGTEALKANKAFIQLSAQSGAPKRIRMVVNHATGVENAAAEVKAEKFIENGQVLIRRGNEVYNLQGQIVK